MACGRGDVDDAASSRDTHATNRFSGDTERAPEVDLHTPVELDGLHFVDGPGRACHADIIDTDVESAHLGVESGKQGGDRIFVADVAEVISSAVRVDIAGVDGGAGRTQGVGDGGTDTGSTACDEGSAAGQFDVVPVHRRAPVSSHGGGRRSG